MKYFLSSSVLSFLVLLLPQVAQAQDESTEDSLESMVLVGALSASVSESDIDFANLPSGMVLRVGANGVQVVDPADAPPIDPSVPRVGVGSVAGLPDSQKKALARKLEGALDQIMTAYDDETVSGDDVIAIVKFLYTLELPYDERFRNVVEERFGPILDEQPGDLDPVRVSDPELQPDPVQVTDPIDTNTGYFAP